MTNETHTYTHGTDYLAAKLDYMNSAQHPQFSDDPEEADFGDHLKEYRDVQKDLLRSIYEQSNKETAEYLSTLIQREPEHLVEEVRKLEREEEIDVQELEYPNVPSVFVDEIIEEQVTN